MFLKTSRYYNQKTVDTTTADYRKIKVLTLRRLPSVTGKETIVKGNDKLDILSQRNYGISTMFWHIADANTDLNANDLLKITSNVITSRVRTIRVPDK